jgi:hypothetical protein
MPHPGQSEMAMKNMRLLARHSLDQRGKWIRTEDDEGEKDQSTCMG